MLKFARCKCTCLKSQPWESEAGGLEIQERPGYIVKPSLKIREGKKSKGRGEEGEGKKEGGLGRWLSG